MFEISSSPVRAVIVTHAVMSVPALVMNIFEPLTIHCAVAQLGARARGAGVGAGVRLGEAERGERLARTRGRGSHSCFCSSLPKR